MLKLFIMLMETGARSCHSKSKPSDFLHLHPGTESGLHPGCKMPEADAGKSVSHACIYEAMHYEVGS
jgi:hypothetical protein